MSNDSTRGKQLQKKNSSRSTSNSVKTEDIQSDWKTQTKTSEKVSRHLGQNTNVRTTLPLPAPITRMVRSHQNGQQVPCPLPASDSCSAAPPSRIFLPLAVTFRGLAQGSQPQCQRVPSQTLVPHSKDKHRGHMVWG